MTTINPADYVSALDLPDLIPINETVYAWSPRLNGLKCGTVREVIPHVYLTRKEGRLVEESWIEYLVNWTDDGEHLCRDQFLFVKRATN